MEQGKLYAIAIFILYIIAMFVIGIVTSRVASRGVGEFYMGGKRLGSLVTAFASGASARSAYVFLAGAGLAYKFGVVAIWSLIGTLLVEFWLVLVIGKRIRRYTGPTGDLTIPDYLESRFKDKSHLLRIVSAISICIFMTAYAASQFASGGKAMEGFFGFPYGVGVAITLIVVTFYTMMGGFLAVVWTDFIQACIMLFALLILPIIAIFSLGGVGVIADQFATYSPSLLDPFFLPLGVIIGFLFIGLGGTGSPHFITKFMAIKDPVMLRQTALISGLWQLVVQTGSTFIGLAGRAIFPSVDKLPNKDPEQIFAVLSMTLVHPVLYGLLIGGLFAALMSTVSSQLLIASSCIARDIYEKVLSVGKEISEKKLVLVSRIAIIGVVVLAMIMQYFAPKVIFTVILFGWAGLGASLGPVIMLSLFWSRLTKWGAFAGIVSGCLITIVWYYTPTLKALMYEMVPGFLIGGLLTVVVSLLTSPPKEAKEELEKIKPSYLYFGKKQEQKNLNV